VCTASAARHPSSPAEEVQLGTLSTEPELEAEPTPSALCLPRRNQSDSTDSKMGSRLPWPGSAAGGTTTSRLGGLISAPNDTSGRLVGRNCSSTSPFTGAPNTGSGPVPGTAGIGLVGGLLSHEGVACG